MRKMKQETERYIKDTFNEYWSLGITEKGCRWLDPNLFKLECSRNFIDSFNQLQLVFNCHSNLHLKEDLSQMNGMTTYGIDIPLEFFRFPYLNDYRQREDTALYEEERDILIKIMQTSKKRLNYGKDESIVNEMDARFEFLTLYSIFEGFCEELLIAKDKNKDSKSIKKCGDFIRHNNLLVNIKSIFNQYGAELYKRLVTIFKDFESLTMLFYHVRNLYTHRNGIVTKRFIENGLKTPKFLNLWYFDKNQNKNIYVINCITGNCTLQENRNLNCQVLNAYFRAFSTIMVEILNMEET